MKLRKNEPGLVKSEVPHYYEVKLECHPNGLKQLHCGTVRDLESVLKRYPNSKWQKIYLPKTPDTVEVNATTIEDPVALPTIKIGGQEIPIQQNLPESELKELEL
jgi:hypothetical protein